MSSIADLKKKKKNTQPKNEKPTNQQSPQNKRKKTSGNPQCVA